MPQSRSWFDASSFDSTPNAVEGMGNVDMSTVDTIAILGTLDTKESELDFLSRCVRARSARPLIVDTTPLRWVSDSASYSRAELMSAAGIQIADDLIPRFQQGEFAGVIVIGGATGSALGIATIQRLPLGVPKVLVSPIVAGDTLPYVDTTDLILVSPIVDFVGRSAYADEALERAASIAAALVAEHRVYPDAASNHIGVTAFGVTSPLVQRLGQALANEGTRVAVFSANGVGGRSFERFVDEGRVFGAFDVTTSELADELFGGVLSAGATRLTAAATNHVPQVVLPGALDFINFHAESSVPEHLSSRPRIAHTASVTLVRTSTQENVLLAKTVADRLRPGLDATSVVLPLRGFSILSERGGPFWDPIADAAFIETLESELRGAALTRVDAPINSDAVCHAVLEASGPWRGRKGI